MGAGIKKDKMSKFTGKEFDEGIGLQYFGARYYIAIEGFDPYVDKVYAIVEGAK